MTQRRTTWLGLPAILACVALTGCGKMTVVDLAEDLLAPSREPLVMQAFDGESADVRREAVLTMSLRRWWGLRPTALKAYALVVRNSREEPTVRCAALRALGRAGGRAAPHIGDILLALADKRSDHVRWDAAVALRDIWTDGDVWSVQGVVLSTNRPSKEATIALVHAWPDMVVRDLSARLKWDRAGGLGESSPDVRLACAEALGRHRRTEVVGALAATVEHDLDYAVRREAHESLVKLVGYDRGWTQSEWEDDAVKLPAPRPRRAGWDFLGLFVRAAPDETAGK